MLAPSPCLSTIAWSGSRRVFLAVGGMKREHPFVWESNDSCTCCWYHFPRATKISYWDSLISWTWITVSLWLGLELQSVFYEVSTSKYRWRTGEFIWAPTDCCLSSWVIQDPRTDNNSEWETAFAFHFTSTQREEQTRTEAEDWLLYIPFLWSFTHLKVLTTVWGDWRWGIYWVGNRN